MFKIYYFMLLMHLIEMNEMQWCEEIIYVAVGVAKGKIWILKWVCIIV